MTNLGCGRQAMQRTVSTGRFTCHNSDCESHAEPTRASYRVLQNGDWFRVFYVPLVPVGQGEQLVECEVCGEVVTVSAHEETADDPAVPFVVNDGPKLEITARVNAEEQPSSLRLVVGAPASDPLSPKIPTVHPSVRACDDQPATAATPIPAPPQRPACTSCGLCGTGRSATDEICGGCGAVFTDRSVRSCVRHRIALPNDVDCPVCGPDGVHELEPAIARSSFFG